jgi:cbb3-type cytochrome oxidase subunit 3
MHSWFPIIFFLVLTGTIAVAVIGWERENRAKAKRRLELSHAPEGHSEEAE